MESLQACLNNMKKMIDARDQEVKQMIMNLAAKQDTVLTMVGIITKRNVNKEIPANALDEETYNKCVKSITGHGVVPSRIRVALAILMVTGLRVSELRSITVNDLRSFMDSKQAMRVDRVKGGPSDHELLLSDRAFLILAERRADMEVLFVGKEDDHKVFSSSRSPDQALSRETLTRQINEALKVLDGNFTSNSFRRSYISRWWELTSDLDFVRQLAGHRTIAATERYAIPYSEEHRQYIEENNLMC